MNKKFLNQVNYFYKLAQEIAVDTSEFETPESQAFLEGSGRAGKAKPSMGFPDASIRKTAGDCLSMIRASNIVPDDVKHASNGLGDYLEDFTNERFSDQELNNQWSSYLSAIMKKIDMTSVNAETKEQNQFYKSLFDKFSLVWDDIAKTTGYKATTMKPLSSAWVGQENAELKGLDWKSIEDRQHAFEKAQKMSSKNDYLIKKYSQMDVASIQYGKIKMMPEGEEKEKAKDQFARDYSPAVVKSVELAAGDRPEQKIYHKQEHSATEESQKPSTSSDSNPWSPKELAAALPKKAPVVSGPSAEDNKAVQARLTAWVNADRKNRDFNPEVDNDLIRDNTVYPWGTYTDKSGKEHKDVDGNWGPRSARMLEKYMKSSGAKNTTEARKMLMADTTLGTGANYSDDGKYPNKSASLFKLIERFVKLT